MKYNYNEMKRFVLRNKIGLIIGLILGTIIFYLFWTKSTVIPISTMRYLIYPLSLLFGCLIALWSGAALIFIYGIAGTCLDGILSRWQMKDDRNRALIILALLVLILGGIYYYKDINNKLCIDANRDGNPDNIIVPLDSDGDGIYDNADICANTPPGAVVDANGCPITPPAGCTYTSSTCPTWGSCVNNIQYCTASNCASIGRSCTAANTTGGLDIQISLG